MLLLGLAAAASAQPQPPGYESHSGPEEIDRTSTATDLRFKSDAHARMTVPVRVSGSGPYSFLVDTGSERSAISRDVAKRLQLRQSGAADLHSVTGMSRVSTATLPLLNLEARTMKNLQAALLDSDDMGADGILGLDSLRSQRIHFDFKKQTLTIVPSTLRAHEEDGSIVVTGRRKNGRLILTEARAEDTKVTAVVDTGAEVTIGNEALRRKLMRNGALSGSRQTELVSVTGGTLAGEYMFAKKLEIGGVTLTNVAIVFADSHAFRKLGLERKPAVLLGMNALKAFEKVSIDFARMKLRVVLPERTSLHGTALALR